MNEQKTAPAPSRRTEDNTPEVAAFRNSKTGTARVLCPICGRIHSHGRGDGNRRPHCGDLTPWEDRAEGYDLVTVPCELPPEAEAIDREVKRVQGILYYRRSTHGWDSKRWKPSTAEIFERWEKLKSRVQVFNAEALKILGGECDEF